jgi:flagellar assembly protein FliH
MSTIIKAGDQNRVKHAAAYNFDDIGQQAGRIVEQARAEAARILAEANEEAAGLKRRAEAEGRRAGEARIAELVETESAERLATLLPALRQAVRQLEDVRQEWLARWEQSAVRVASAIAARVIRRELAIQPEIPLALIREALDLAAGSPQVRIHVNPADHARLGRHVEMLVAEFSTLSAAEIVPDAMVTPGGCRVETRFGVIDQQVESQLARIEEELA